MRFTLDIGWTCPHVSNLVNHTLQPVKPKIKITPQPLRHADQILYYDIRPLEQVRFRNAGNCIVWP